LTEYEIGRTTPRGGRRKEWIVDGQQRITALSILWRKKPYWIDNEEWERLIKKNKVKSKYPYSESLLRVSGNKE